MHSCTWCEKEYTTRGKLKKHTQNKHPDRMGDFLAKVSSCPRCGISYSDGQTLGGHIVWCTADESLKKKFRDSLTWKGRTHSESTRQKLSRHRSEVLETKGGGGFTTIRWFPVKNLDGTEYVVRGTWERDVADWLTKNNVIWIRRVYLSYTRDNKSRTYTPDFYLPEFDLYLEVKGYFSQADKEKLRCVVEQNNVKLILVLDKHIKQIRDTNTTVGELLSNATVM